MRLEKQVQEILNYLEKGYELNSMEGDNCQCSFTVISNEGFSKTILFHVSSIDKVMKTLISKAKKIGEDDFIAKQKKESLDSTNRRRI